MDNRRVNEEYAAIGQDLIDHCPELKYILDSEVLICYLSSDQERTSNGKVVYGQCEKVPEKYRWAVPCDFTITVFEPNVIRFTDEQIKILIFHELLHIGIDQDGNDETYRIRPHDVEEFREIINKYGIDWDEQT